VHVHPPFGSGPVAADALVKLKEHFRRDDANSGRRGEAKISILISVVPAGKTTFMNILFRFIPETERIRHHRRRSRAAAQTRGRGAVETRPPTEGQGAVRQRQLLINSLRMRPDRIIIGEFVAMKAFDMLQA